MGQVLAQSSAHRVCIQDASWPADMIRATSDRPCRVDAPMCAHLLGAFDGDPWRSRALYAICTGPGRGHGDGVRPCPHLIGTGVRCRRQPRKVPPSEAALRITRCRNKFPYALGPVSVIELRQLLVELSIVSTVSIFIMYRGSFGSVEKMSRTLSVELSMVSLLLCILLLFCQHCKVFSE
jgi:hypothetical protein